jgi:hypothetical protein
VRGAPAQSRRKGRYRTCSWKFKKSEVKSCKHQNNTDIHCQAFPESVSEEQNIHNDYDRYHRHHVKHASYLFTHSVRPRRELGCIKRLKCRATLLLTLWLSIAFKGAEVPV